MSKPLKILFHPRDGVGNVNASIGVAEVLRKSGHRIIFAISEQWRGKLKIYGFEEELLSDPKSDPNVDPAKQWTEIMSKMGAFSALSPIEKMKAAARNPNPDSTIRVLNLSALLEEVLNRCKPDVIVMDNTFIHPSIKNSGIPWVLQWSSNPLMIHNIYNDNLPPFGLGIPCTGNKDDWEEINDIRKQCISTYLDTYNKLLVERGYEKITSDGFIPISPYLNIYDFPEEIDYVDELPENYQRFDCFMRSENTLDFETPEKLINKPGKLIYLSLGSMGSGDVNLMKRLVSILSKSPHKFLVSKGPFHYQYELADNMWGEKTVPQTKVLPMVDLFITHGGTNSIAETFYFGKPMIVMPFWGDTYDNAQRVHETGYGIRLDPYTCTETELLEAIENLINDRNLEIKMNIVSKRIQSSNKLQKVVEMIEKLVEIN